MLFDESRSNEFELKGMTQDEKWEANWKEVMGFMEENHRRPSKFIPEERGMRNWWKHQQKLVNAGALKPERMEMYNKLRELGEKYRRLNQYAYITVEPHGPSE